MIGKAGALTTIEESSAYLKILKSTLHNRVFFIDISLCPHCGGNPRAIADVTHPAPIDRILARAR